jgi:putative tryptophan/tyrosine transport system substrate-binding protein
LVALGPDVLFATSGVSILPLQEANRDVALVFAQTIDPVGLGVVESLSRPGGNATGFTQIEFSTTAKWLELLKQIAPAATHAAVLRDPFDSAGIGQCDRITTSRLESLALRMVPIDRRNSA